MKIPENSQYVLFGGSFVLANKMQLVADKSVGGLSTKQWFLLRTLKDMPDNEKITITALAKQADSSRQNITKMLETLERSGCVLLTDNPADHRSRHVEFTDYGLQMLNSMAAKAEDFFKELFSGISEEKSKAAAGVIIEMIANLEKMQKDLLNK